MPAIERPQHPSHNKQRNRKGRGLSSGSGKTSGRGQTGQKSRSGNTIHPRFEGGQAPNIRKFAKYSGFKNHRKIEYHPVNLGELNNLPAGTVVDLACLLAQRLLPKKLRNLQVKLLGNGEFNKKLTFKLHAYSHRARAKVESAGGTCEEI